MLAAEVRSRRQRPANRKALRRRQPRRDSPSARIPSSVSPSCLLPPAFCHLPPMIAVRRPTIRPQWLADWEWPRLDPLRVLPLLTVVLLLTSAPDQWYLRGPLVAAFALGVVYRRWLAAPQYWYVVATLLGTTVYLNWESADNHKYLFVYWCLALCSAHALPREQQAAGLALSSRWLIGLCMLLAAAWKLASPDYLDGSFFHFTLLGDERFAHFTAQAAGLPLDQLAENRGLCDLLRGGHLLGENVASASLADVPRVAWLAQ